MKKLIYLVIALVSLSWSQAYADYSFKFGNGTYDVSGILLTSPNGDGSFTVTGGTVSDNGANFTLFPIIGSTPHYNAVSYLSPSGHFAFDNQLSPGSKPMVTYWGLLFTNGLTGSEYKEFNIWSTGTSSYVYMEWDSTNGFSPSVDWSDSTFGASPGKFSAASVPIPPVAWLLGTGLMGLLGIRRKLNV